MPVVFGTPVAVPYAAQTSVGISLTGISSGQPILLLAFMTNPSIDPFVAEPTDNFATPYGWTLLNTVIANHSSAFTGVAAWIGKSGAGTSGTITLSVATGSSVGLIAVPCSGLAPGLGFGAFNGNALGYGGTSVSIVPPSASDAIVAFAGGITGGPGAPWSATAMLNGATEIAELDLLTSPVGGVTLTPNWTGGPNYCVAMIVNMPAAPLPLGTVRLQAVQRAASN